VLGWALLTITTAFAAPSDKPTILICPKTLASSFWLTARAGAYQAANKFGVKIFGKVLLLKRILRGKLQSSKITQIKKLMPLL
jgi:ABC-type sugar transport system substrate-binding protein